MTIHKDCKICDDNNYSDLNNLTKETIRKSREGIDVISFTGIEEMFGSLELESEQEGE